MREPEKPPPSLFTLFLGLSCIVLAVLTLLLTRQNLELKNKLAAAVGAPAPGSLQVGDTLSGLDVVDTAGHRSRVAFEGPQPTLLLVFSSTCGACRETIPVWNRLLSESPAGPVHVVGLQTDFQHNDSATATLPILDPRVPVFGAADSEGAAMAKFPAIPVAALLDGKGVVKATWVGVPTDAQVSELRHALRD